MENYIINGKAIYTPKGAALEYGRVGCNFYTGCPHDCDYCFLKRGAPSKQLGGTEVKLKKCFKDTANALDIFYKEVKKNIQYLRENGLFFSFTTDPLIPETRDLTITAMNFCIFNDIPVKVLTKNADFIDYYKMGFFLKKTDRAKKYVSFGFTLTGRDDMEHNASENMKRIDTMRRLHFRGYKTFASIEPVIDWDSTRNVVKASLDCCDHFKIGLRSGVKKDYYDDSEIIDSILWLKHIITNVGKTVYFKESIRKRATEVIGDKWVEAFLKGTLDMDGNPM